MQPNARRPDAASLVRAATLMALLGALAACAPRRLELPSGPGRPLDDPAPVYQAASSACAGIRTMTAELRLSGRAGGTRLRGRLLAGLERPASLSLEAVAPFGAPLFILGAQDESATLLFPRDDRVLRGERVDAILETLAGVRLTARDLLAILAGCAVPDAAPAGGREYDGGWVRVDLSGGATVYVRRRAAGGPWRIVAARVGSLEIEYAAFDGALPSRIRIRSSGRGGSRVEADLGLELYQVETNVDINPAAFAVKVPVRAEPMTLDELRRFGPLGVDSESRKQGVAPTRGLDPRSP